MSDSHNLPESDDGAAAIIASLREVIAAIDRRVPHAEREAEQKIAQDAAELRRMATLRIRELEQRLGLGDPPTT